MPLFCGLRKPVRRLLVVLRYASAFGVTDTQVELRMCIPLRGCLLVPKRRLLIVLRYT